MKKFTDYTSALEYYNTEKKNPAHISVEMKYRQIGNKDLWLVATFDKYPWERY